MKTLENINQEHGWNAHQAGTKAAVIRRLEQEILGHQDKMLLLEDDAKKIQAAEQAKKPEEESSSV